MSTNEVSRTIVEALEEQKGEKIVVLDIHEVSDFADVFIICNGTSDRLLGALAKSVLDKTREIHKIHGKIEGIPSAGWLVIDYGDVIVHLFSPDQRDYYQLEQLWSKGKVLLLLQ